MSVPEKVISATSTDIREMSTKTTTCYTFITIARMRAHTHTHTHICTYTAKAYRKQRQNDCSKFKASLAYIVRKCLN